MRNISCSISFSSTFRVYRGNFDYFGQCSSFLTLERCKIVATVVLIILRLFIFSMQPSTPVPQQPLHPNLPATLLSPPSQRGPNDVSKTFFNTWHTLIPGSVTAHKYFFTVGSFNFLGFKDFHPLLSPKKFYSIITNYGCKNMLSSTKGSNSDYSSILLILSNSQMTTILPCISPI